MTNTSPDILVCNRTYLVLVTETVVARDIAQIIADFDPASAVICTQSLPEALAALNAIASVTLAFVAGGPASLFGTDLHSTIVDRGGRIVLLGTEAEKAGPSASFDVLPQPFDTDAVIARLMAGHRGCNRTSPPHQDTRVSVDEKNIA